MIKEEHAEKYRHEYKYVHDRVQNAILKARVRNILHVDHHTGSQDYYTVRSLYFDSPEDHCFYENEDGVGIEERAKYRIRIYNADRSYITLEKKSKRRQMALKSTCIINERICRQLMSGQGIRLTGDMTGEQQRLLSEMQCKALRPAVIVEYQRYPFIERNGNVRITFDEHLCSSNDITHFLEERIICRPILQPGHSVLEVKWDEFISSYLKEYIQLETLQWNSFSKYYLCRKYNTYGGIRT